MSRVISLELNEVDFELLRKYVDAGKLPTFERLLARYDLVQTTSETEYAHLEPWIQWVTAHTGLTFSQHGVFRLGDIVGKELRQLWEVLEERFGLRVAAVSPMNARNVLKNAAFFVPDPWTQTATLGPWDLRLLSTALVQTVNDNAQHRITVGSYLRLAAAAAVNVRAKNLRSYAKLAATSRTKKWRKALVLDQLLCDAFIGHCKKARPDYASLFLNAAAHVQHHYMFSSPFYRGELRNPDWYIEPGLDPVGEVYALYDEIIASILTALPDARLLIATGLSQQPNHQLIHYYRPKDHLALMGQLGLSGITAVQPRMSRDFLVEFDSPRDAAAAQRKLEGFVAPDGVSIFSVENRGKTLFCMLCYTRPIERDFTISNGEVTLRHFEEQVAHVSIENAIHRQTGYFLDTGLAKTGTRKPIPLTSLFDHTLSIWDPETASALSPSAAS
ncbi:MAG: hypothetical protein HOV81_21090 [Kofleriaceae bacterium]|nr:hypothetical protein [Kofleriaceae bacterium]